MGGCRCSFRNCPKSSANSKNIHFFHYPTKHTERCFEWIKNSEKNDFVTLETMKLKNKVICQLHFEDKYFMNYKKDRLTHDAIPRLMANRLIDIDLDKASILVSMEQVNQVSSDYTLPLSEVDNTKLVVTEKVGCLSYTINPIEGEDCIMTIDLTAEQNHLAFSNTNSLIPHPDQCDPVSKLIYVTSPESVSIDKPNIPVSSTLMNTTQVYKRKSNKVGQEYKVKQKKVTCLPHNENVGLSKTDMFVLVPKPVLEVNSLKELNNDHNTSVNNLDTSDILTPYGEIATDMVEEQDPPLLQNSTTLQIPPQKSKQLLREPEFKRTPEKEYIEKIQRNAEEIVKLKRLLSEKSTSKRLSLKSQTSAKNTKYFPQSSVSKPLTKLQLFVGLQKYLNPSIETLLRMELFGSADRPWKDDERELSLELYQLGPDIYKYMTDELRWRLPPPSDVEDWTEELENDLDEL